MSGGGGLQHAANRGRGRGAAGEASHGPGIARTAWCASPAASRSPRPACHAAAKIKAHELRGKGKEELLAQVRPGGGGGGRAGGQGSQKRRRCSGGGRRRTLWRLLPSQAAPGGAVVRMACWHGLGAHSCSSRPSRPACASSGSPACSPRRRRRSRSLRCRCRPPPLCLQLKDLKQELSGLRVAKVTGGAPNKLSKM